ncbi:hypothetical protein CDD81_1086 [Ophiocordyceps australis]|uniref:Uncharacterized protein n=1 Tax=Ophiocordyceps australis TaxID=1399860 RepID=A0A2C5Y1X9_9HYPO|nr:hypothetical protein CDD81_1086 [Ophiocordyceps australis]
MAKSVCIVGAGPSGVVAAKTLVHNAGGGFRVSLFEAQNSVGGLWPSRDDKSQGRLIDGLMVCNQSQHTMHFSDMAWEAETGQMPRAWQVGRYIEGYVERYLDGQPAFTLRLSTRVVKAEEREGGWEIETSKGERERFEYLVVASGYFGEARMADEVKGASVPVVHSSAYTGLHQLLQGSELGPEAKILVVGGQLSGVEAAAAVARDISTARHGERESGVKNVETLSVEHIVQHPVWIFPLYTCPKPEEAAPSFLPLDCCSYNLANRSVPLENTQGHVSVGAARRMHALFEAVVGTDQSEFGLRIGEEERDEVPYLAMSDVYADFVRSGLISVVKGRLAWVRADKTASVDAATKCLHSAEQAPRPKTATAVLASGRQIANVAAMISATGFDAASSLDFLPASVLDKLGLAPEHGGQVLALGMHATLHANVARLGFVGFYRSPYWGVMQMQARLLAALWSLGQEDKRGKQVEQAVKRGEKKQETEETREDKMATSHGHAEVSKAQKERMEKEEGEQDEGKRAQNQLCRALAADDSIARTLALRNDARLSQFPMGDYPWLMQEFSSALCIPLVPMPAPLNSLCPARYPCPHDDAQAQAQAAASRASLAQTISSALSSPRFVPRAVFRSLLGKWNLQRSVTSRSPSHPSGLFSGTATFSLRDTSPLESSLGFEYVYREDGTFCASDLRLEFRASRSYVWRYHEASNVVSVWFVRTDGHGARAVTDYLFHELEFGPRAGDGRAWSAVAAHLCLDDWYNMAYEFVFCAVNLRSWSVQYTVSGPKKDYSIKGTYTR